MVLRYIFVALSALFLLLAIGRCLRDGSMKHPRTRAWGLVGLIFGAVSAWLFYRG